MGGLNEAKTHPEQNSRFSWGAFSLTAFMGEKGEKSSTKREPGSPHEVMLTLRTALRSEGEGTFFFFAFSFIIFFF